MGWRIAGRVTQTVHVLARHYTKRKDLKQYGVGSYYSDDYCPSDSWVTVEVTESPRGTGPLLESWPRAAVVDQQSLIGKPKTGVAWIDGHMPDVVETEVVQAARVHPTRAEYLVRRDPADVSKELAATFNAGWRRETNRDGDTVTLVPERPEYSATVSVRALNRNAALYSEAARVFAEEPGPLTIVTVHWTMIDP